MVLSLLRREAAPAPAVMTGPERIGIIDIGSNSIRLVVYEGAARIPAILFNEKVMAGLGKSLAKTGAIDAPAMERAERALARFRRLAALMEVSRLRTVATAAVRDASNGSEFLRRLAALGLEVELISGDEEGRLAGLGVLAAIPEADGVVGDLGGGSLELIRVARGMVHERLSLPLGVLRLEALRQKGPNALGRAVAAPLKKAKWTAGRGLPFYLVGGSWRALARLDMHLTHYPLPIIHHYRMEARRVVRLARMLQNEDRKRLREVPGLSAARAATLGDAAVLLATIVRQLGSEHVIASAYGLREGLIHASLPAAVAAEDPLLAATRDEGRRQGRFPEHGDLLDRWIAPLFGSDPLGDGRLRHAACLLADIGWRANPEFRAERGVESALHGNWVGIDARGRAMVARALFTSFGGQGDTAVIDRLIGAVDRAAADRWGLAIRLGQRLGGGVAQPLEESRLELARDTVTLGLGNATAALGGEAIERRLKALAVALGRQPVFA